MRSPPRGAAPARQVVRPVNTHRAIVVAAIGSTQTIAWASSYYMPAILGAPIAGALHLSTNVFFGLFSAALLLSAAVGPSVGRLIDRHGGRVILAAANLVIAAGLVILAAAHGIAGLVIAWAVLGIGIGMGLYDPAFAALTWLYGREARGAITGITLIAGFASTIGWPLSALFLHEFGWRAACLIWAGLNLPLASPVNWLTIPRHAASAPRHQAVTGLPIAAPPRAAMPILVFFFCGDLVRSGSNGGASAGFAASCGRFLGCGDRRRSIGRTGSGRRPPRRIRSCCARFTRFPRRGLPRRCTRSAPRSSSCSAFRGSSHSRCCTVPATA